MYFEFRIVYKYDYDGQPKEKYKCINDMKKLSIKAILPDLCHYHQSKSLKFVDSVLHHFQ